MYTGERADVFAGRDVIHADGVPVAVGTEHVLGADGRRQPHHLVVIVQDRHGRHQGRAGVRQPGGQRHDKRQRVRVAPLHALRAPYKFTHSLTHSLTYLPLHALLDQWLHVARIRFYTPAIHNALIKDNLLTSSYSLLMPCFPYTSE